MTHDSTTCCPRCGSDRPTWRIKRDRAASRDSRRELLWSCGGCGAEWTEPISVGLRPISDAAPDAASPYP